jgi:hypothetical protein
MTYWIPNICRCEGTQTILGKALQERDMNAAIVPDPTPVLTSWKDIARYMGKGVRTVQRWEMDFGLPVRRPQGSNKKAVLARPRDLDAWVALRCTSRAPGVAAGGTEHSRMQALTSLSSQIQTSHMLHDTNRVLISEVQTALDLLRSQIVSLRLGR